MEGVGGDGEGSYTAFPLHKGTREVLPLQEENLQGKKYKQTHYAHQLPRGDVAPNCL